MPFLMRRSGFPPRLDTLLYLDYDATLQISINGCKGELMTARIVTDYGILREPYVSFLKRINSRAYRKLCQTERRDFEAKDKKWHNLYSNLFPGFSSQSISVPTDVPIIGEAHGGGGPQSYRAQKDLEYEVSALAQYYRNLPDKTFHQQQVRILLDRLDRMGKTWVFTDLIKCFVWHRVDKKSGLDGAVNWAVAIKLCRRYLEREEMAGNWR